MRIAIPDHNNRKYDRWDPERKREHELERDREPGWDLGLERGLGLGLEGLEGLEVWRVWRFGGSGGRLGLER